MDDSDSDSDSDSGNAGYAIGSDDEDDPQVCIQTSIARSSCTHNPHTTITFFIHYYFPHSLSALSHSHVHDCRPDSKQVLLALLEQVAANGADSLEIGCCSAELRVLVGDAAGM